MYKFKENDIILNTVVANPRYKFTFFNGVAYVNDQVDNGIYQTGTIHFNDLNILGSGQHKVITNLSVGFNKDNPNDPQNYPITGSAAQSFSLSRDFIRKGTGGVVEPQYTTGFGSPATSSIAKFIALQTTMNQKRVSSRNFKFENYFTKTLSDAGTGSLSGQLLQDINILSLDRLFYGSMLKPGSINLEFYKSGSLIAKCQDTDKNGELIEKTNTSIGVGSKVGLALYEEGIIILTSTGSLATTKEFYLQPTASGPAGVAILDNPRWTHFASYINVSGGTASAITGSSYIVEIQGTTPKPALTMFAHAPKNELNWSNNPTYIDASSKSGYINVTSSNYYEESTSISVKNIVSSSFSTYSASFDATTYIKTIGVYDEDRNLIAVAKVANPVKKTTEQDYTFKLKLDL